MSSTKTGQRLQEDLTAVLQYLTLQYLVVRTTRKLEGVFISEYSGKTIGNGFKQKGVWAVALMFDVRSKFFTHMVVRHWKRLPRESVDTLEVFKARLYGALINLV